MALVVLLRGVNVGGHRTFRPSALVRELAELDVVNIGAAGTFVVRERASQKTVREAFAERLPFDTAMALCDGRAVLDLLERNPFAAEPSRPDLTRFVSVLAGRARRSPNVPFQLPKDGPWMLRVIARHGPFVCGVYRRHMRAVSHLGALDQQFGVPVTTRNWNTITAIGKALDGG